MPDLWKALGDVYGDTTPDAPPVKVEAPAAQRAAALPLDDDLAAALSAALVNAPAAPAASPTTVPVPESEPGAQDKVASWLVEIETRQELREKGPDLDAALPEGPTWSRPDDDIVPAAKGRKRRR